MAQSSFSPHSRWDRHIPETNESKPPDTLNEKIEVVALFKFGQIKPLCFTWKNQEFKIKKITYNWQERRGKETINYFSVDTDPNLYQISFNNTTYCWQIDKIIE